MRGNMGRGMRGTGCVSMGCVGMNWDGLGIALGGRRRVGCYADVWWETGKRGDCDGKREEEQRDIDGLNLMQPEGNSSGLRDAATLSVYIRACVHSALGPAQTGREGRGGPSQMAAGRFRVIGESERWGMEGEGSLSGGKEASPRDSVTHTTSWWQIGIDRGLRRRATRSELALTQGQEAVRRLQVELHP